MAETFVRMDGVPELLKRIQGLSYDASKKGGRFALRKAAQVIRDSARANAQTVDSAETGRSIARNINERWASKFNKSTGNLMFRVGVLGGAKIPKNNVDEGLGGPTPHFRLLEFGTEKMQARPFFAKALPENAQRATDTFVSEFNRALDRALKKAK